MRNAQKTQGGAGRADPPPRRFFVVTAPRILAYCTCVTAKTLLVTPSKARAVGASLLSACFVLMRPLIPCRARYVHASGT